MTRGKKVCWRFFSGTGLCASGDLGFDVPEDDGSCGWVELSLVVAVGIGVGDGCGFCEPCLVDEVLCALDGVAGSRGEWVIECDNYVVGGEFY